MEGTMMEYPLTLVPLFERAGTFYRDVEVVSRLPDRTLHRSTYGDIHQRARALAEALQGLGLRRGDRVGTLMWNHYAHLEAYFGIPLAGGVIHTLNLRLPPDDLAYIADHGGDRFLIVDDVLMPLLEQIKDRVNVEGIIVVPLTGRPAPADTDDYEELLQTAEGRFEYPELDEKEAAGMCYTSGTTGRPKGVVYSHRALVLHTLASTMADTLGLRQDDVVCPVVPMFHVNAWGLPFTAAMVGTKQVHPGPYLDPESLLDLYEREQVTVTAGVPTIWFGILQALRQEPHRWSLPPMRMIVGGAAAPESMIRDFDRIGHTVIHAWGMTETTPLGSVSTLKAHMKGMAPDDQYAYRAKQGLPAPFVEVRAVDESGVVPWDGKAMGELQVRGPWVASRYHDLPESREKWTEDGWFRTGDVVTIDSEGYIKICDRIKDLIKSGGEWVSSVDLENALVEHPEVAEAAVIAVPHPKWGERPLAAVVLREGAETNSEKLRQFLADRFPKWWLPDAYAFVDEIPRTSTGKYEKKRLREMYRDWGWES